MQKVTPVANLLISNLLTLARAFAKARGIKLKSVSRFCHSDPEALENLSRGKGSITLRKYDTAMEWLAQNWPEDQPWPALNEPVFRPSPK